MHLNNYLQNTLPSCAVRFHTLVPGLLKLFLLGLPMAYPCISLNRISQLTPLQLAHRDVALTQELKGVLDACISSSATGSEPSDLASSIAHDADARSSVHCSSSLESEWEGFTQPTDSQPHHTGPRGILLSVFCVRYLVSCRCCALHRMWCAAVPSTYHA